MLSVVTRWVMVFSEVWQVLSSDRNSKTKQRSPSQTKDTENGRSQIFKMRSRNSVFNCYDWMVYVGYLRDITAGVKVKSEHGQG